MKMTQGRGSKISLKTKFLTTEKKIVSFFFFEKYIAPTFFKTLEVKKICFTIFRKMKVK